MSSPADGTRRALLRGATGALALTACLSCAGRIAPADRPLRPVVLDVQGHRGCRGLRPENSIEAIRKALDLGVTTIELDLQVTRDRVIVLHHDQALDPDRCRRDDGRPVSKTLIRDLDFRHLADIDCGVLPHPRFPEQKRRVGTRIPSLDEALRIVREDPRGVRLNLEIKMQDPRDGIPVDEFARLLLSGIRESGLTHRVVVQSFHAPALDAVARLDPSIPRAILAVWRRDYDRLIERTGARILSPRFQRLRRRDVRRFHRRGIAVVPWTVNEPGDIRRMIRWGVDGIISDYPDRVIEICRRIPCGASSPS